MKRINAAALCTALFFILIGLSPSSQASDRLSGIRSYLCFYEAAFPSPDIPKFDLYIFDSSHHPNIAALKKKGSKVVGYVTLGEISTHSPDFARMKKQKLLVDENKNWPGSYRVDIRKKAWHKYVVDELIPRTLKQGFDGIFIDTIDTAEYLKTDKKIAGSIAGAVELIKGIRKKYPSIAIVLNNGLFLIDKVGGDIDALLVEDVYTLYDFKTKRYNLATLAWTAERLPPLKAFQKAFRKPVLTLDYLKATDKQAIREIADKARKEGFVPYISDIHLQTIFFKP